MTDLAHRYLRPADLHRLRHVRFAPRRSVQGLYAGRHASPQRGRSVEFNDYRAYMPGDEVAAIDWKVFGRSDRLVVKRFEHQSELNLALIVDASASMAYAGTGLDINLRRPGAPRIIPPSKYDHAARLAAAMAFVVTQQQDAVAFAIARRGLRHYLPAGKSPTHLRRILDTLDRTRLGETAQLPEALTQLARRLRRRSLVIVLGDLLDDREATLASLAAFAARGCEVIVFHILHADELHLPDNLSGSAAVFVDSETDARLPLNIDDIRDAYQQRITDFTNTWSAALRARGIDYNLISTADNYHESLRRYLLTRTART